MNSWSVRYCSWPARPGNYGSIDAEPHLVARFEASVECVGAWKLSAGLCGQKCDRAIGALLSRSTLPPVMVGFDPIGRASQAVRVLLPCSLSLSLPSLHLHPWHLPTMSWLFGSTSKPAAPAPAAPPAATTEDDAAAAAGCPVDHSTRSRWLQNQQQPDGSEAKAPHPFLPSTPSQAPASGAAASRPSVSPPAALSHEREVSSIPRWLATDPDSAQSTQGQGKADGNSSRDGNWVYPSPNQFYTALQRKNRNPAQADMDFVVPIHNAVNERTWDEVMKWECGTADAARQDVKLVSFKGRPQDVSPRAWFKTLLG